MKLLRNPLIVGALVLIALVVVVIQFKPRFLSSNAPVQGNTGGAPTPVPAVVPQPNASAAQQKAPPGSSIDVQTIEANSARWNNSLQRDPFLARSSFPQSTNAPARDLLTLNAIWRQTSGDLAVINNRIVVAGDRVLMFSVSRIEADGVWVDGPNGPERIEFTGGLPAKSAPAAATAGAPAPGKPGP